MLSSMVSPFTPRATEIMVRASFRKCTLRNTTLLALIETAPGMILFQYRRRADRPTRECLGRCGVTV